MSVTIDTNDPALRDELGEIVRETLDGLVDSVITTANLPESFGHEDIVIESALGISGGGASATLTLRVPAPTAIAMTAAMVGESCDDIDLDDACGTVGELSNVISGTAKTLIAEETVLHVPSPRAVAVGELPALETVVVHHRLGRFEVHLGS